MEASTDDASSGNRALAPRAMTPRDASGARDRAATVRLAIAVRAAGAAGCDFARRCPGRAQPAQPTEEHASGFRRFRGALQRGAHRRADARRGARLWHRAQRQPRAAQRRAAGEGSRTARRRRSTAPCTATAYNLNGQLKDLEMRRVQEGHGDLFHRRGRHQRHRDPRFRHRRDAARRAADATPCSSSASSSPTDRSRTRKKPCEIGFERINNPCFRAIFRALVD